VLIFGLHCSFFFIAPPSALTATLRPPQCPKVSFQEAFPQQSLPGGPPPSIAFPGARRFPSKKLSRSKASPAALRPPSSTTVAEAGAEAKMAPQAPLL
jgi:hypothetical protein